MNLKKLPYQEFIYKRTYSRYLDKEKRREEWNETVDRYKKFFEEDVLDKHDIHHTLKEDFYKAIEYIREFKVMPSMRCLWTAGEALRRDNIGGYNCSYLPINSIKSFADVLYILMNGTGVGFSTERQYVSQLPEIPEVLVKKKEKVIVFDDSKLGWAEGFLEFLTLLYDGIIPKWDLSKIRPKGARLKTFGGQASGPEPLERLLIFTMKIIQKACGRKLNSLECYDVVCMVANCVVSGGVRRSATINLSNLSDDRMRHAKEGQFWIDNSQRTLSNNSVAYTEKPEISRFMEEWLSLMKSGTGERGIFNRKAAIKTAPERRKTEDQEFGTNPCGEIVIRPHGFCNLTEVVVRHEDSLEDLKQKVKYATILGCLQSTLTDFKFISKEFKKNCEKERLLGVSLTGLMDHPVLQGYGLAMVIVTGKYIGYRK